MQPKDITTHLAINQTQLAEIMGVTRQVISQYLNGDRGRPNKFVSGMVSEAGLLIEQVVFYDRFDNAYSENPESPAYWLNLALEALNEAEKRGADISGIVDAILAEGKKHLPEYFAENV